MRTVELLFVVLDILLAAHFAAWYLGFATRERTDRALDNMRRQEDRVRLGVFACGTGMIVIIAYVALTMAGLESLGRFVRLAAYPFLLFGAASLASATWKPPYSSIEPAGEEVRA